MGRLPDGGTENRYSPPDSVEALAALYAAERADVQNVLAHSLSMIAILVGYAAVVGAVLTERPDVVPHWMFIFLPLPLLAAMGWHSQMNSLVFAHNQSISVLEEKLMAFTPTLSGPQKLWVGANCGRLVTDVPILWKHRRIGMLGASLTAYGVVGISVLALTIRSVMAAADSHHNLSLTIAMGVLYALVIVLIGASYLSTFRISRTVLDDWAKKARHDKLI